MLAGLSVHVQGVHHKKEAVVFGMAGLGLHIHLDELKNEAAFTLVVSSNSSFFLPFFFLSTIPNPPTLNLYPAILFMFTGIFCKEQELLRLGTKSKTFIAS